MPGPDINPKDAVDLEQVARAQQAAKKVQEEQAMTAAMDQAVRYDNAMQRTFKGIYTRKERHGLMTRSVDADS